MSDNFGSYDVCPLCGAEIAHFLPDHLVQCEGELRGHR